MKQVRPARPLRAFLESLVLPLPIQIALGYIAFIFGIAKYFEHPHTMLSPETLVDLSLTFSHLALINGALFLSLHYTRKQS